MAGKKQVQIQVSAMIRRLVSIFGIFILIVYMHPDGDAA